MTFKEFETSPPKRVRVHDKGLGRNLVLRLSEKRDKYTTGNMGTKEKRVYHDWSIKNAFECRITS